MSTILSNEEIKKEIRKSDNNYYQIVELNEILYLNDRLYKRIDHLSNLHNLKALYLSNNDLECISGLDECVNLAALYLNGNQITKIENLSTLTKLRVLNLENNHISVIENLDELVNLEELNLANNCLGSKGSSNFVTLTKNTHLSVLNLSNNEIKEDILDVLSQLKEISVLYTTNNPIMSTYKNYRKLFIYRLKNLGYLDFSPITPEDRRIVEAFFIGGIEKEQEERKKVKEEKRLRREKELEYFKKYFLNF